MLWWTEVSLGRLTVFPHWPLCTKAFNPQGGFNVVAWLVCVVEANSYYLYADYSLNKTGNDEIECHRRQADWTHAGYLLVPLQYITAAKWKLTQTKSCRGFQFNVSNVMTAMSEIYNLWKESRQTEFVQWAKQDVWGKKTTLVTFIVKYCIFSQSLGDCFRVMLSTTSLTSGLPTVWQL